MQMTLQPNSTSLSSAKTTENTTIRISNELKDILARMKTQTSPGQLENYDELLRRLLNL
jgi:hypothetical protein